MQDIRYAIRSLRKQPVFTLVAVLTLTLGIGANTAIFSLLYQVLLRPLPYGAAARPVFVWNTYPLMGLVQAGVSIPDYLDRKSQAPAFEDATLFTFRPMNLNTQGQPEQVRGLAVTPSFFTTLGRQPFIGHAFSDDEKESITAELCKGNRRPENLQWVRFKGLGEMDADELGDTTMDRSKRTLLQVTVEQGAIADEVMSVLMGEDVEARKKFIVQNAGDVRFLDI